MGAQLSLYLIDKGSKNICAAYLRKPTNQSVMNTLTVRWTDDAYVISVCQSVQTGDKRWTQDSNSDELTKAITTNMWDAFFKQNWLYRHTKWGQSPCWVGPSRALVWFLTSVSLTAAVVFCAMTDVTWTRGTWLFLLWNKLIQLWISLLPIYLFHDAMKVKVTLVYNSLKFQHNPWSHMSVKCW